MQSSATGRGEELVGLVDGQAERDVQAVVGHDLATVDAHRCLEGCELGVVGAPREQPGRQVTEVALDEGEPLLGGEVTAQGEHGVVRGVVRPEERVDVVEARGVEVLHRADRRVVVGVALREHRGVARR